MADMDTMIIRNRPDEYISATLGPDADKVSKFTVMRMIAAAIKSVEDGEGREIDLTI